MDYQWPCLKDGYLEVQNNGLVLGEAISDNGQNIPTVGGTIELKC